jgi:hypothetical protein
MAYVFWMHSLLCCTDSSTCLTVFTATVTFSLSSQELRNLQAVTEWMCQILMWCLHLLSCFASCLSKILYPSTNSHNTTFQKKVIPIASNTRVDGIKDKRLAQSCEQKFFKKVTAYTWKRKSTLLVPTSTRDFCLRNHEIKIPERIRSCTYNTADDDVFYDVCLSNIYRNDLNRAFAHLYWN